MKKDDTRALLEFRRKKDWHWKNDQESPLTAEQKKKFKGLSYFPPNQKLRFELVLDRNIPKVGKKVTIKTTADDKQIYLKAGKIRFKIGGKIVEAAVYEDPEQEQYQYYLLFKDKTTGKETYENGRMLPIEKRGPSTLRDSQGRTEQGRSAASSGQSNKLIVDFNYAYNPYSAYNDNWDCPITPKENVLPVEIRAGEKKFD